MPYLSELVDRCAAQPDYDPIAAVEAVEHYEASAKALDALDSLDAQPESGNVENVMTCSGHDEAQARIARAVHEIQVLCDHFGYDPSQWLADAICHPDEAPERWDCLICGGVVDLSNPIKPTEKVGPGGRS